MKTTNIDTINDHLSDGAVIQAFAGTLTSIFEMNTIGQGEKAWTKQNGVFRDASGKTIKVEFRRNGEEIPQNWKGKQLLLESVKGDKGTHGVKILDDEYKGTTTRKLCITSTAAISFLDGDATAQNEPQQQRRPATGQQSAPATQSGSTQASRPAAPHGSKAERQQYTHDLRLKILQRATVWQHCYDAAVACALAVNDRHGFAMVSAGIGALTTSLYIDTMKGTDISQIDVSSVDWSAAKGKTMSDHLANLDAQMLKTHAGRAPQPLPAPASTPAAPEPEAAAPAKTMMEELEEQDEIPF